MLPSKPLPDPTYLNIDYLFYKVYQFFQSVYEFIISNDVFSQFYFWAKIIFSIAAIFFIAVIIYSIIMGHEVHHKEKEQLKKFIVREPSAKMENEKWLRVMVHINSTNSSDWRVAILEADTILDEMIIKMGYAGDNLGDRLKKVEPRDFESLNDAWEAHKVRNNIAHEGSNFILSHEQANKVIGKYERVFREFKYI